MKKVTFCLPLLIAFAILLPSQGYARVRSSKVGNIVAIQGKAYAVRHGKRVKLSLKGAVYALDTLKTGDKTKVQIMFKDSTIVSLASNTSVSLKKFAYSKKKKSNRFLMRVTQGVFRLITGAIVKRNPENFKVQTPQATIGIRGTTIYGKVSGANEQIGLLNIGAGHSLVIKSRSTGVEKVLTTPRVAVSINSSGAVSAPKAVSAPQVKEITESTSPVGAVANVTSLENSISQPTTKSTPLARKVANRKPLPPTKGPTFIETAPNTTASNGKVVVFYTAAQLGSHTPEDVTLLEPTNGTVTRGAGATLTLPASASASAFDWNRESVLSNLGTVSKGGSGNPAVYSLAQWRIPTDPHAERYNSYIGTYRGTITTSTSASGVTPKSGQLSAVFVRRAGHLMMDSFTATNVAHGDRLERTGTVTAANMRVEHGLVTFSGRYDRNGATTVNVRGGLHTVHGKSHFDGGFASHDAQGSNNRGTFKSQKQ